MIHATLKMSYQFLNCRKLPTSYLFPFKPSTLAHHGIDLAYVNVSKLSFIGVLISSLVNQLHPGYRPAMSDENQRLLAEGQLTRLVLENPLQHDIRPINFLKKRGGRVNWVLTTIGKLLANDILKFLKLLCCGTRIATFILQNIHVWMFQLSRFLRDYGPRSPG